MHGVQSSLVLFVNKTKPNLLMIITRRVCKQLFPTYLMHTRDQQPSMSASLVLGLSQCRCRGYCWRDLFRQHLGVCVVCTCCLVCRNIWLKRMLYLRNKYKCYLIRVLYSVSIEGLSRVAYPTMLFMYPP